MAFSRKHYKAIAGILATHLAETGNPEQEETVASISRDMAEFFKSDNPEFSYMRFYRAIGLDGFGEIE